MGTKEYYKGYRQLLQAVVDKSEDEFEKKLIYIAAGALGLSFTFISDIVDMASSKLIWIVIAGWILLIGCICLNLSSHILSKNKANQSINDIDKFIDLDNDDDVNLRNKINKRNNSTEIINYTTIGMLVLGVICILFFASYNIINSTNEKITKTEIIHER